MLPSWTLPGIGGILRSMSKDDEPGLAAGKVSSLDTLDAPAGKKRSLLSKLRLGALFLLAAAIIVVVARNWYPIRVDLMGRTMEIPLSVLVILTFFAGTTAGLLLAYFRPWRKS